MADESPPSYAYLAPEQIKARCLIPNPTPKLTDQEKMDFNKRLVHDSKLTVQETERLGWELAAHREKAIGNYWCWMGDGEDHPESLTCPVLVSADQVREWVAARSRALKEAAEVIKKRGCCCLPGTHYQCINCRQAAAIRALDKAEEQTGG